MMKYRVTKLVGVVAALVSVFTTSCTKEVTFDYAAVEQQVFDEWMAENHEDLLGNRQEAGYYIDLIDEGDTGSDVIADSIYWIQYEFTGTDLSGNVCLTRNELTAWQQGTFTKNTYYTPYYRISSKDDFTTLEGTHLALVSKLKIGDEYKYLYNGAEFTLYMPSSLVGADGITGTGGYEGQFSLSKSVPMIAHIKITDVVDNPLKAEGEVVDQFAKDNGGLTTSAESSKDDKSKTDADTNAWTNSVDSIPQLYVNTTYLPEVGGTSFEYVNPYVSQVPESAYNKYTMAELDEKINEALLERFGSDAKDKDDDDEIGMAGEAKIWYIGRFLDGFIFDTNIDEVKEILYGPSEDDTKGSAISFKGEDDATSYITSWYYTIPQLKFGQWAAILTTSTYGYGAAGMEGRTSTSSSSSSNNYNSYYDMYNYYNSYYGSGYGGGYYDNYYGGGLYNNYYGGGMYNNYYNYGYNYGYGDDSSSTTTTTTTVITEVPSFAPLLFEIYVEPAEDEE